MIAPKMPGSESIGQAILDHQAHCQGNDALGVMTSRRCQIGHIGIEVELTKGTAMFRVGDMQVAGAILAQAANLVENALDPTAARRGSTALRTSARAKIPRALLDQRLGQILNTCDPFRRIGEILARSHALSSVTSVSPWKSEQKSQKQSTEVLLRCYSLKKRLICSYLFAFLFAFR